MNALNFCYWLQGYLELTEQGKPLTSEQVKIIQQHMALVLTNITSHGAGTGLSTSTDLESVVPTLPIPRIASTC